MKVFQEEKSMNKGSFGGRSALILTNFRYLKCNKSQIQSKWNKELNEPKK